MEQQGEEQCFTLDENFRELVLHLKASLMSERGQKSAHISVHTSIHPSLTLHSEGLMPMP